MASVRPADEGTDPLRALTDACVHCGFCLPACPTYQLDGEEAESPRGRIHLLRQLLEGEAGPGPVLRHLDNCLGCLACVPACPSGVAYDQIVTVARERVEPASSRCSRTPGGWLSCGDRCGCSARSPGGFRRACCHRPYGR
jgi:glycolate oxidase iron-sulfur subunit